MSEPQHTYEKPEYPKTPRRSSMAEAYSWVSRIMSCTMTMVLPGIAGGYLDNHFGTSIWEVSGWILGPIVGFIQLLAITKGVDKKQDTQQATDRELDK